MKSIVYLSEAYVNFSESDLEKLAKQAAYKNKELCITGYLCFSRERFIQYLEGEEDAVNELLNNIREDPRHKLMYEIELNNVDNRVFSSWSMRYITSKELAKFNIEHCIEQNLLYIKNNFPHKERCREFIWEHVKTIEKIKDRLTKSSRWTTFPAQH